MRTARIAVVILAAVLPAAAQACTTPDLTGAYGFQLSGTTTISGEPKRGAAVGRLEFDGQGGISGASSVNFSGYYLGNPVTGTYEAHPDCSITWTLQDGSGAIQHFAGTLTPDLRRATFHQSDPGGLSNGVLVKVAAQCSPDALAGVYTAAISGSALPMNPEEVGYNISMEGKLTIDAGGHITLAGEDSSVPSGSATVDPECVVDVKLTPSDGAPMNLRGVLVAGKEILAIETDPGTTVTAHFHQH